MLKSVVMPCENPRMSDARHRLRTLGIALVAVAGALLAPSQASASSACGMTSTTDCRTVCPCCQPPALEASPATEALAVRSSSLRPTSPAPYLPSCSEDPACGCRPSVPADPGRDPARRAAVEKPQARGESSLASKGWPRIPVAFSRVETPPRVLPGRCPLYLRDSRLLI
jgi:hypothetical protein